MRTETPTGGPFELRLVAAHDGGLARPAAPGRSLSATDLAALVGRAGLPDGPVRIAAPVGEQHLPTLAVLAGLLDREILFPPATAGPRPARPAAVAGADSDPADWWSIPASGRIDSVAAWFRLVGEPVLPRTGPVTLRLPGGGLMFATRETFGPDRTAAEAIRPGHPGIVTVCVRVRDGAFVIGEYSGRSRGHDGLHLAAGLAQLPLYGAELRMWLTWPAGGGARARLRDGLLDLADATGGTVWAPREGSRAALLDGCHDLTAIGPDGEPTGWEAFGAIGRPAYESDVDGRLVPAGGVRVQALPGMLLSTHPDRERELAQRYGQADPAAAFGLELAVLADGRLALRYADGGFLAAGARQLERLLRDAGWAGGPVTLLSPLSPEQVAGAQQHAADLARQLGAPVELAEPSTADRLRDRTSGTSRPRPEEASIGGAGEQMPVSAVPLRPVAVPAQAPPPDESGPAHKPANSWLAQMRRAAAAPVAGDRPSGEPLDEPLGEPLGEPASPPRPSSSRFFDGPRIEPVVRGTPPHGISWLPAQPQANSEEFEVHIACPTTPDRMVTDGVPSPHLFLLGHLDQGGLAARTDAEWLVAVRVGPGGAVDVTASEAVVPDRLRAALGHNDVYLLPAAWLSRASLLAAYRVTPGGVAPPRWLTGRPLRIQSQGAEHGVAGLPNEVVRWPQSSLRTTVSCFVVVPESPEPLGTWLRLHQHRPAPAAGHRLLELRVGRRAAVDVPATATTLRRLSALRSRAERLTDDGVDLLLPAGSYAQTTILREYRYDAGGWQRRPGAEGQTLAGWAVSGTQTVHAHG
ncbi:hypothetical protein ABT369_25625 [Dactylosporangium sp. NPDC000244]|uniref:hypothetical protein n=1 Tax=Dactylosporangium sp. NPDC000244 TaxID=3154365 RepID=UPI00331ACC67